MRDREGTQGGQLKIWRGEASQRALGEKHGRGGPFCRARVFIHKSVERFLAQFKLGVKSKVEKRRADSIDDLPAVNAVRFKIQKLTCSCYLAAAINWSTNDHRSKMRAITSPPSLPASARYHPLELSQETDLQTANRGKDAGWKW
jgi:hypothetical protein